MAYDNTNSANEQDGLTTQFKVVIPELKDMVFKSCEGLESEIEVLYFSEGGLLGAPKTARGAQRVHRLSFGQGTSSGDSGKTIFDWYLDVCDSSKPLQKKTLSITITDREGKKLTEWRVINAWPCRWNAPLLSRDATTVAVEYVSFAHEGIERKK